MSIFRKPGRSARAVVAAAALVTGLAVATVPTIAQADTPGCATKVEYRHVHKGMGMTRVRRILDTRGMQMSAFTRGGVRHESRMYQACRHPRRAMVHVEYKNGRVATKMAMW